MPITRDKENACWRFEFDRVVPGKGRVRARKRLPKAWSRAEADAFDRAESARLYAIATGTAAKPEAGIEDAVLIYLEERLPNLKHGHRTAQELALTFWAYRGRKLADLPEVAALIRKQWAGKLAPATVKNRIRYLTAACRYAFKHHALCEHDPAARVVVPQVDNARQVYVDRAGMLRLAKAAPCRASRAMIRIAFYTGMRMGELFAARVDAAAGVFALEDTKNGDPRWVPIHRRIRCCLRYLPFELGRTALERRWRMARDAAGMAHMHFHDLRHSTASALVNAGVDLYTVGKVLGHRTPISTKRYAHLDTRAVADALDKIGKRAA